MRRLLIVIGLILCICAPVQGASTPAKDTILAAIDDVLVILQSGDYSDPTKKDVLVGKLRPIMNKTFDFPEMSMRTVGRSWRTFSKPQQTEFSELFSELLTETYIGRLQDFSDEKVHYIGERESKRGNIEVQTEVVGGGKQIPIAYRMMEKDSWVVYDVLVEGVSLVKNYRSQFMEILVNGSPEELLQVLRDKVATLRTKAKTSK